MGCGTSAPAPVLVPQPRGGAEPILSASLAYQDGVAELSICDESWWKDQDARKARQKALTEVQSTVRSHIEFEGTESVVNYKNSAGETILTESRDFWAIDTQWSTVTFRQPAGVQGGADGGGAAAELVAVVAEGVNEKSVAMKAFSYQNCKGKALLFAPTVGKKPPTDGHVTKTMEGVPMHVVGEVRSSFDSCAFHPAAAGGKFEAATLKLNVSGTVKNASGEAVAIVVDPYANGLWNWVLNANSDGSGAPLQVAANVDIMMVVAVISQYAANRKANKGTPQIDGTHDAAFGALAPGF